MTTVERTTIEVDRKPGIIVVHLAGDLRLFGRSEEREELLATFRSGIEPGPAEVVVDLKQLTHVDTHGVAAVAQMLDQCYQRGIRVKGLLPSGMLGRVFRTGRTFDRFSQRDATIADPARPEKRRPLHGPVLCAGLLPFLPQQLALN